MGKIALNLNIDVSKIDKKRLFKGTKGVYMDATIFVDLGQLDQFGNSGMITQNVSKEEKEQGVRGAILGNGKVFWVEGGEAPQKQAQAQGNFQQNNQKAPPQNQAGYQQQNTVHSGFAPQQAPPPKIEYDDDIPF